MKINLIICIFVHLLNLILKENFEPEPGFELGPPDLNLQIISLFSLNNLILIFSIPLFHIFIENIGLLGWNCARKKKYRAFFLFYKEFSTVNWTHVKWHHPHKTKPSSLIQDWRLIPISCRQRRSVYRVQERKKRKKET